MYRYMVTAEVVTRRGTSISHINVEAISELAARNVVVNMYNVPVNVLSVQSVTTQNVWDVSTFTPLSNRIAERNGS